MRLRGVTLGTLLLAISILGPVIAYAGITVIYPKATHSVNVDTTPPITFAQGSDYAQANTVGFASAFTLVDNSAAFTMTLSALSGGAITIDKYVHLVAASTVTTFKAQVATAAAGTLNATEIEVLKVRLWTGGSAPTADGSAGVCAVLDLEAALDTESAATCAGNQTVYVQVVFQLATGSAGSSTVSVRPSSIVFA